MFAKSLPVLLVCGLLSACATPMPPSTPPMPQMPKPQACLTACPTLPNLTTDDEIGVIVWLHELIDVAGQCRRMHDACRSGAWK